jgi:hypothetical protein
MKKQLLCVFIMCLTVAAVGVAQDATPAPSPAASPKPKPVMSKKQIEAQLIKYENELWEAWKNKNGKPFQARLSSDGVTVGEQGTSSKAETVKAIATLGCDIKSFKLSDYKLVSLDSNVALLTYKATEDGSCGGTALPPVVWAASTYVRRGGKWLAVFHQETPAR